jgi:hypothetical protein
MANNGYPVPAFPGLFTIPTPPTSINDSGLNLIGLDTDSATNFFKFINGDITTGVSIETQVSGNLPQGTTLLTLDQGGSGAIISVATPGVLSSGGAFGMFSVDNITGLQSYIVGDPSGINIFSQTINVNNTATLTGSFMIGSNSITLINGLVVGLT